jgi:hypothetical protein
MDNTNKNTVNKSPDTYITRLLEITNAKYTYLREMLEMTSEQAVSIDGDQIAKLEDILDGKQRIIEKIDKLDDEFEVYFHRLKSEAKIKNLEELNSSEVKGLKELKISVSNVMGIIKELSDMEQSNSSKAKKALEDIGNELKSINVAKKVNSAYGSIPLQTESFFIDKKK